MYDTAPSATNLSTSSIFSFQPLIVKLCQLFEPLHLSETSPPSQTEASVNAHVINKEISH